MLMRRELQQHDAGLQSLLKAGIARPLVDVLFDWFLIVGSVIAVQQGGWWLLPLALLVIGNRQRSLGNLLHDAAHRNLSRNGLANDTLADLLVAPALLADLAIYRDDHHRHHRMLGVAGADPDLIHAAVGPANPWFGTFRATLLERGNWGSALLGNLLHPRLPASRRAGIALWWSTLLLLLAVGAGADVALLFPALWFGARISTYHAISVFRELCDHFGLQPGGILSFTRDIHTTSPLRWLIHPRNDGYHLTHHLMPAVPYHRLPQAHAMFRGTALYRDRGCVCDGYFFGPRAVISPVRPLEATA